MAIKTDRKLNFVDWCPTGFRCGINYEKPVNFPDSVMETVDRTVFGAFNSTCFKSKLRLECEKMQKMFKKKAYLHWFLEEGMEESTFAEAGEKIQTLIADYEEL